MTDLSCGLFRGKVPGLHVLRSDSLSGLFIYKTVIHHQGPGYSHIKGGVIDGFDLYHMLALREYFTRQTVNLRTQQVNSPDRMDKAFQRLTTHFNSDKLGSLRTGCQERVKIIITTQRDPFIDPQHIGDLMLCLTSPYGKDPRSSELPGAAPQRPDIFQVLRPVNTDFKITKIVCYHDF